MEVIKIVNFYPEYIELTEWITTATALWEVRVNKLKKLYSI